MNVDVEKTLAIVVMSQQDRLILCLSSHTRMAQKKDTKEKSHQPVFRSFLFYSAMLIQACKKVERCVSKIQALAPLWELDSFWLETAPETFACAPEHT